jgi:hypothetical protein
MIDDKEEGWKGRREGIRRLNKAKTGLDMAKYYL